MVRCTRPSNASASPRGSGSRRRSRSRRPRRRGPGRRSGPGRHALVVAPTGSGKTLAAFLWSLDRLLTAPVPDEGQSAAGSSTSPRSRRSASTSSATCGPRWPASATPPTGSAPARPGASASACGPATPPPQDRRRARHHAARHPDHHARVAVPDAHLPGARDRCAASRRSSSTRCTRSPAPSAAPTSPSASSASTPCSNGRPSASACPRPSGPLEEVARFLGGPAPVEIVAPPSEKAWDLKVVVPVEDMTAPDGDTPYDADRDAAEPTTVARLDLAARRGARRRPDRAAPLDDRLRQLPPARRAADRPAQRDRHRPRAGRSSRPESGSAARADHGAVRGQRRGRRRGDRQGPPRLGVQGAARPHRGRPQARPAALRGRDLQPRARHRHGRGRPGRPDRVAAVASPAPSSGSAAPATRSARCRAACCSPSTAATSPRPPSPSSGCAPARSSRCGCRPTRSTCSPSRSSPPPPSTPGRSTTSSTLVRRSAPFADAAPRSAYDATLDLLSGRYPSDEFAELRPRLVWDRVAGTLTGRPGAQRLAVTSGGTIPDRGLFGVFLVGGEGPGRRVGELDEEMVYESRVGDVFALGATSWRIEDITHDRVLVTPAPGIPGRLPFWKGDTLGRPAELGEAIGAFTRELAALPAAAGHGAGPARPGSTTTPPATWSATSTSSSRRPACCRATRTLLVERFRDELGDWRLVLHSPYGTPGARALGAGHQRAAPGAVRRRRPGDGLRRRHRDPDPRHRRRPARRRRSSSSSPTRSTQLVTDEVGGSALFASRFRECAARALLLPRRDPGRRSPLWQQRQRSAAAARGRRQVPLVPDRPRGRPRVPAGRLRPAGAGRP